ncbi:hypothetical protein [Priestia koreensis]|uniref:hypothetical protein n=1 Tax=Priestia koreensis TaxID=284581 RepID=UPI003019E518
MTEVRIQRLNRFLAECEYVTNHMTTGISKRRIASIRNYVPYFKAIDDPQLTEVAGMAVNVAESICDLFDSLRASEDFETVIQPKYEAFARDCQHLSEVVADVL